MAFTFAIDNSIAEDMSVLLATWSAGATGDSGIGVQYVPFADACVQVTGTFGGGTVTIEGSNDNTTWATLNNAQGTALTFTATGLKQVTERPRYIRPAVTGGAASAIVVTLLMRRPNPLRQ